MGVKRIRFDFNGVMAGAVGQEHGVSNAELDALVPRLEAGHRALAALRTSGKVAFYDLPSREADVKAVEEVAASVQGEFDAAVVLGIGGSALGALAIRTALCHSLYNESAAARGGRPRLYVEDNIDPDHTAQLLETLDPQRTLFLVVSKSGGTVETLAQMLLVRSLLGGDLSRNVIAITDPDPAKSVLRQMADQFRSTLPVPHGVGGRFSVLSPAGLLPAALCGVDIRELLSGARDADRERCSSPSLDANDAYRAAAVEHLLYAKGHRLSVMMPYASALRDVADWYRQLWAESLGKGEQIGPTPIKALGVTDQHSQVQLYREGPNDKVFCFLAIESFGTTLPIPAAYPDCDAVSYVGGHTFNELIERERVATALALEDAKRPTYTVTLPELSAYTLGQLFHLLEVKTAISGQLYGVDAFNQPGVEAGKALAFGLMGRKGYESARQWVEDRQAGKPVPPLDQLLEELGK